MSHSYRKPYAKIETNDKSREKRWNNKKIRKAQDLNNGCFYKKIKELFWNSKDDWDVLAFNDEKLNRK